jgi:hypothetical protein
LHQAALACSAPGAFFAGGIRLTAFRAFDRTTGHVWFLSDAYGGVGHKGAHKTITRLDSSV